LPAALAAEQCKIRNGERGGGFGDPRAGSQQSRGVVPTNSGGAEAPHAPGARALANANHVHLPEPRHLASERTCGKTNPRDRRLSSLVTARLAGGMRD
jgi:hypothetical protein